MPRSPGGVLAERRARLGLDAPASVDTAAVPAVPAGSAMLAEAAGPDGQRGEAALLEAIGGTVRRMSRWPN
ncbi:hypothetical protein [Kitasatospora sp. NPDC059327]|uniref:hypothetical protein n=1 Tax=Kitasatospora sp. NPDC059327 TaxID=3346803 RepID=UPI0036BF835A